jgi:hypothetical protein
VKEKFLILEVAPKRTNGWFLSVDEDRNIIFEKIKKGLDLKKISRSIAHKEWEGRHFFKSRRRVAAVADPRLATTIPIPLDLVREHYSPEKARITVPELENLIAQAMAKIFNGCRTEAAKRLSHHELDTVLVGARAKNFKVDGEPVSSPEGFPGKKISLLLELTFTTRELFQALNPFFNSTDGFFFAEAPQARVASLARIRKLPINLLVTNTEGSSLFVLENAKDEYPVLYRESLNWSFGSFIEKIMEGVGVSKKTARELYKKYVKGDMSETAQRAYKKTIQPALDAFSTEIGKGKLRGIVYIDAPYPLPLELPHRESGATFEEHPIEEVLKERGFSVNFGGSDEMKNERLRPVMYFLEAYFDKSNSDINQKLRRRLHWLAG